MSRRDFWHKRYNTHVTAMRQQKRKRTRMNKTNSKHRGKCSCTLTGHRLCTTSSCFAGATAAAVEVLYLDRQFSCLIGLCHLRPLDLVTALSTLRASCRRTRRSMSRPRTLLATRAAIEYVEKARTSLEVGGGSAPIARSS